MTEVVVYQCDVTGEQFSDLSEIHRLRVKRRYSHNEFEVYEHTVHVSDEALDTHGISGGAFHILAYVTVHDGTVVGAATRRSDGRNHEYRERDSVVIDYLEPVFTFIEDHVID